MAKIAVVQHPPCILNRDDTIRRAVALIDETAGAGAKLIIFPEAFIPGYPAWIWRLRPGGDWGLSEALHAHAYWTTPLLLKPATCSRCARPPNNIM
jgi:nitrilase